MFVDSVRDPTVAIMMVITHQAELQRRFFEDFEGGPHESVATFRVNDRPIYMALCS